MYKRKKLQKIMRCGCTVGVAAAIGVAAGAVWVKKGRTSLRWEARRRFEWLKQGWAFDDVLDLGDSEMKRFAQEMRELALTATGSPAGYESPEQWLEKRDPAEFADETNMYAMLSRRGKSKSHLQDVFSQKLLRGKGDGNKTVTMQTNTEVGIGYSAWQKDLLYAADVLELEAESQNLSSDLSDVLGSEEAERIVKAVHEEFDRTWAWVGQNLSNMWS